MPVKRLALALVFCLLAPVLGWAAAGQEQDSTITVLGHGMVQATPDQVTMTLGVTNLAVSAQEAAAQNAAAMEALIKAVKARLGEGGTVKSVGYRLSARQEWDGKRSRHVGFQASNQVRVKLTEVGRLGGLLDAAVAAGVTDVSGPSWGLSDPAQQQRQAQALALADAQGQAQALAQAAGLSLGRLKRADLAHAEQGRAALPAAPLAARAAGPAPETPVEPGQISLQATAYCVWQLQ